MTHLLTTLVSTLLLAPLAALHAADTAANPGIPGVQGIGPNEGAPAIAMDGPPKLIPDPSATKTYN